MILNKPPTDPKNAMEKVMIKKPPVEGKGNGILFHHFIGLYKIYTDEKIGPY